MDSFAFDTIKTICVLIFVIVIMIFTLKGLSKYQNKLSGNKNIKILERASLSQNTTLNIVKVGEKLYLMSSGPNGINILHELSKEDIDEDAYKTLSIEDIKYSSIFKNGKAYVKKFKGKVKDE